MLYKQFRQQRHMSRSARSNPTNSRQTYQFHIPHRKHKLHRPKQSVPYSYMVRSRWRLSRQDLGYQHILYT